MRVRNVRRTCAGNLRLSRTAVGRNRGPGNRRPCPRDTGRCTWKARARRTRPAAGSWGDRTGTSTRFARWSGRWIWAGRCRSTGAARRPRRWTCWPWLRLRWDCRRWTTGPWTTAAVVAALCLRWTTATTRCWTTLAAAAAAVVAKTVVAAIRKIDVGGWRTRVAAAVD